MNPDDTQAQPSTASTVAGIIAGLSAAVAPWYNVVAYGAPAGAKPSTQAAYAVGQPGSLAATGPLIVIALAVVLVVVIVARTK